MRERPDPSGIKLFSEQFQPVATSVLLGCCTKSACRFHRCRLPLQEGDVLADPRRYEAPDLEVIGCESPNGGLGMIGVAGVAAD